MNIIAITGPRKLTDLQAHKVSLEMVDVLIGKYVLMGDAAGVDFIAERLNTQLPGVGEVFAIRENLPHRARYAERSSRMVKRLAELGGALHAWPNKPAPAGLRPSRNWPKGAQGSGTWGTIAMAVGCGCKVELHPLVEISLPEWLKAEQLALC